MSPYGELVLTNTLPTVVEAPARTLLAVEALRALNSVHLIKPDVICVGEDAEGSPVIYPHRRMVRSRARPDPRQEKR